MEEQKSQQQNFDHNYCQPFQDQIESTKTQEITTKQLAVNCHSCMAEGFMNSYQINIPLFKEMILMSFKCSNCGISTNETSVGGGGFSETGIKYTLNVDHPDVLQRDLYKSETCQVHIPEIDLQMIYGTLGGVYTTVEGLLKKIQENLQNVFPYIDVDENDSYHINPMMKFFKQLNQIIKGEKSFTLILTDLLTNSFIKQENDSNGVDGKLKIEIYHRTEEDDIDLGIHDMNTKDFETIPNTEEQSQQIQIMTDEV